MNMLRKIFIPLFLILFVGFFVNWVAGGKTPPSILSNENPQATQTSTSTPSVIPSASGEVSATIVYEDPVTVESSDPVSTPKRCLSAELAEDGCVIDLSEYEWSEKICSSGRSATSTRFFVNTGAGFVHMKLYRTADASESGVETIDDSNDGEDRRTFRKAGIPYPRCIRFLAGASREVTVQTRSSWSF